MTAINYNATASAVAWTPSQDRTVVVPSMSSQLVRGIVSTEGSILMLPQKQPAETLDFSFDISSNLSFGDTIAKVVSSASQPTGLTCIGAFGFGTLATVWLDGGGAGQLYLLGITITTVQGRVRYLQATILVPGLMASPSIVAAQSVRLFSLR
jgi:hypothetical protein